MHARTITITPQFNDLDPMEVVWHGNYPRFFEQARCELLESIGYNYPQMKASGYVWPIVDMRIKYVRPLTFLQAVTVTATITEWQNRLKIDYMIHDQATQEVLTKAFTIQVAVELATGDLCLESPAILLEKLGVSA